MNAQEMLLKYGQHLGQCGALTYKLCDCGFSDAVHEAAAETSEAEAR